MQKCASEESDSTDKKRISGEGKGDSGGALSDRLLMRRAESEMVTGGVSSRRSAAPSVAFRSWESSHRDWLRRFASAQTRIQGVQTPISSSRVAASHWEEQTDGGKKEKEKEENFCAVLFRSRRKERSTAEES